MWSGLQQAVWRLSGTVPDRLTSRGGQSRRCRRGATVAADTVRNGQQGRDQRSESKSDRRVSTLDSAYIQ
jgi:hypothetical protein